MVLTFGPYVNLFTLRCILVYTFDVVILCFKAIFGSSWNVIYFVWSKYLRLFFFFLLENKKISFKRKSYFIKVTFDSVFNLKNNQKIYKRDKDISKKKIRKREIIYVALRLASSLFLRESKCVSDEKRERVSLLRILEDQKCANEII